MTTPSTFGRRTAIKLGLAGTAAVLAPRRARAQSPREVKIALLVPLSGAWARQGILKQMGAELAIEDVNSSGGIKALGGAKLKLVPYDTGDTAEKAKNAAQRLVAQEPDVVGGMGSWLSSFTLAVTEVTERAELPWLTLSYSDLITGRGFKYVFQSSPTAEAQATALLPRVVDLASKAGSGRPTKVAFIGDNSASSVSFMKAIRGGVAKDLGLTIVADETYTPPLARDYPRAEDPLRPSRLHRAPVHQRRRRQALARQVGRARHHRQHHAAGRGRRPLDGARAGQDSGQGTPRGHDRRSGQLAGQGPGRPREALHGQDGRALVRSRLDLPVRARDDLQGGPGATASTDRRKVGEMLHKIDLKDGPAKLFPDGRVKYDDSGRRVGAELCIVQWQKGRPVAVHPESIAVSKAVWPKLS
jgi:branched-chain amino acid transport system substrate-binding protein